MTRAEYRISLKMWNDYIRTKSPAQLMGLDRAWGSLGKALTHFQATVAMYRLIQEHYQGKKPSLASMYSNRLYATIVKEMDNDTTEVLNNAEKVDWQEEIYFY